MKEKNMPRFVQKQLDKLRETEGDGPTIEAAVLDKASELGYEVEDEYETPNKEEKGAFVHNVKVVKRSENSLGGEEVTAAWIHFNHPAPEYENRPSEWFWYIL